ncbi:LOW QUALITY PROTEIN: hypothetical protein OSB04_030802 [Centaurea solstitialis]|uniref:Uncharacterized protein n=1 Tax=Centaurea solstitialis TaxID=347529 RepID=A0AA38W5C9_9ASTR|nr:LOW QUALITY PROTEIN: hypothetical protein OSB04_030802 [Centaurea solstitialis]
MATWKTQNHIRRSQLLITMNPRSPSASNGIRSFATLLICRYRVNSESGYHHIGGGHRLPKFKHGIGSSMHQGLSIASGNSMKRPESKMVKLVLGSMLPLMFSFWKQRWDNMLKLEAKVEEVVKEAEEVAEVVEKVASTTEKLSAEVAEKLQNGQLKEAALMVEHVSSVAAKDAHMTQDFIHKVGDLKQDLTDLETMVEPSMEIKIRSIQSIKPSKPTPESLRNYKLSLLDQLASSSYINLILYYKPTGEVSIFDRLTQLVKSLSEVLTLFYPLAGRITEDGLTVDCSDQGVKYLEWIQNLKIFTIKIDHINQLIGAPDEVTTTLVIQVNIFDCGGFVIGVSAAHKVTDASNLVRFINEWASINNKGYGNGAFRPSFDNMASLFPPREISSSEHSLVPSDPEAIIFTKRFEFTGKTISKLRAKAGSTKRKHSRVTLVASLIWKALIDIDQVKSGSFRDCLLAPAINLRGKAGSPISESSFGNVWTPYPIRFLQSKTESKFVDLVNLIEDTTRDIIMWVQKASSEEICTQAMACYAEVAEEVKQNKFSIFTSWCRFPIYEANFGWGKPTWASDAGSSIEIITLMDDRHGDGIIAWVSLNEKDMCAFEQDEDLLALPPKYF